MLLSVGVGSTANAVVVRKPNVIKHGKVMKTKPPSMSRPKNIPKPECPPMGNSRLWKKFYSDTADLGKYGDRQGQIVEVQHHIKNPKLLRVVIDVPEERDLNGWKAGWYESLKTTVSVYTPSGGLIKTHTLWHKDRRSCHVYPVPGVSLRTTGGFKIFSRTEWMRFYLPVRVPWSRELSDTLSLWIPNVRTPIRR